MIFGNLGKTEEGKEILLDKIDKELDSDTERDRRRRE
jgi:hypothetical protein